MAKPKRSPLAGIGLLGLGLLLIIGAVPVGVAGVQRLMEEWTPSRWPTAEATITHSKVIVRNNRKKGDDREVLPDSKYIPTVQYEFEVDGAKHQGERIAVREPVYEDVALATELALKYDRETKHTVHYNPIDPSDSVLEIGVSTPTRWLTFTPVILIALAGLVLWGWKLSRRPPKKRKLSEFDI